MSIAFSRRTILRGFGAALATIGLPTVARAEEAGDPLFATAFMEGERFGMAILDRDGNLLRRISLPGRGHDVTADSSGDHIVAFARRPGTFALALDRRKSREPQVFHCPPNRHFYGHGLFIDRDRLLVATENDYEKGRGVLGLYDAMNGFRRIDEWSSHGVGPHDLALSPDGRSLIVANGGMETHPDFGRQILNLALMEPSLVFLDAADGSLKERHTLPPDWSRLSTRHMDITAGGRVFVGCQWQGEANDCPPLLLSFARGEDRREHDLGKFARRLNGYVGSVSVNNRSGLIAITSPHGDIAIFMDAGRGEVVGSRNGVDLCGVAPLANDFVTSTGTGRFGTSDLASMAFDNHILAL
ncbi:hypothetical protein B7H23_01065 [Notoacmeibacter marinus]|uniref:DUF1513 domain-containing protein n=1 Tax=Notoacmeibacter marinus TaxID=1876515 RepID=A0A231V1Z1_9HYPH|nr:DUF1513 domain-containing protein [Notoacmeibacter marinus]OXT01596.1 hypothetical protein B7H23_01065 [Notoacmeibacter marinus]